MTDFQKYWSQQYDAMGNLDDVLRQAENQLGVHLPGATWKGHEGVKFIVNLGTDYGRHLRVRKSLFTDLGLDYYCKLNYKTDYFIALLIDICREHNLDIDTILGCSWIDAPQEGNYVLGVVLTMLVGLKSKSFLLGAVSETMKKVESTEYQKNTIAAPIEVRTALATHFNKYKKDAKTNIKSGTIVAETFPSRYKKYMDALKGASEVLTAGRSEIKTDNKLLDAVRARIGNNVAKNFAQTIGINEVLDKKLTNLDAQSDIELFDPQIDGDEAFPEELGMHVNFNVDIDMTRAFVRKVNTATQIELLKKAKEIFPHADVKAAITARMDQIHDEEEFALKQRLEYLEKEQQRVGLAQQEYQDLYKKTKQGGNGGNGGHGHNGGNDDNDNGGGAPGGQGPGTGGNGGNGGPRPGNNGFGSGGNTGTGNENVAKQQAQTDMVIEEKGSSSQKFNKGNLKRHEQPKSYEGVPKVSGILESTVHTRGNGDGNGNGNGNGTGRAEEINDDNRKKSKSYDRKWGFSDGLASQILCKESGLKSSYGDKTSPFGKSNEKL